MERDEPGRWIVGLAKDELLATIADETTARQLKQAQSDLKSAEEQARLELPSSEPLKIAEANVERLEKLTSLSNVPAVELEKAKSEAKRLRDALETEKIERERNLASLREAVKKAETLTNRLEIRAPMDGILSDIKAIDGEFVSDGAQLFTVSSRKNYVRGEVNEEDIGEVKVGMPAVLQMYAFRTRQFKATVTSIVPAADPDTQRYTVLLDLQNPPENLLAGKEGEHYVAGMKTRCSSRPAPSSSIKSGGSSSGWSRNAPSISAIAPSSFPKCSRD